MRESIPFEKYLFWGALTLYVCAWGTHLYVGTVTLRGFVDDSSLAFLIHLSESYVFYKSSSTIHLFSVGFPRDAQLFLNALSLQVALWLNIRNPATLKYIFVFWQFALPGFLYLILFALLWWKRKLHWAIFPLISWAILSVSVDTNAVNSSRWALPIFWMHFFLVLFAERRVRAWPLAGVLVSGVAMWWGLYEAVMLHCCLSLAVGMLLWVREKNKIPFTYALAAAPGACRAFMSYVAIGHTAPNNFHGFGLFPDIFTLFTPFLIRLTDWSVQGLKALASLFAYGQSSHDAWGYFSDALPEWYFYILLISAPILYIAAIAVAPRVFLPRFNLVVIVLIVLAIGSISGPPPTFWMLLPLKFDYIVLSFGLMAGAATLRVLGKSPANFAAPAAVVALLAGSALWMIQVEKTGVWRTCRAGYEAHKGDRPLIVGDQLYSLIQHNEQVSYLDEKPYYECLSSSYTPWTDLLLSADGKIDQWPFLSSWQDFGFVEKNGEIYLHTNHWTLIYPSVHTEEADLPLKTLLYDLTPLYDKLGLGPFVKRLHCQKPETADPFLRSHLLSLDNDKRALMFVCPR